MSEMPATQSIHLDVENHIAQLRLTHPQTRNSMDAQFWRELALVVAHMEQRSDIRAIVVSGEGPHFSSGIDLNFINELFTVEQASDGHRRDTISSRIRLLQQAFLRLERLSAPVIMAVHGGCIGAALEFACAGDLRICTTDTFFQLKEVQLGIVADLGGLQRLTHLIPTGAAREMAYTGRRISAEEALTWGLVNRLCATVDALQDAALDIARQIAANPPLTMKYVKETLVARHSAAIEYDLRIAATQQVAYSIDGDARKALAAIREGKSAEFDDLVLPRGLV